jgi:hypothetical protein
MRGTELDREACNEGYLASKDLGCPYPPRFAKACQGLHGECKREGQETLGENGPNPNTWKTLVLVSLCYGTKEGASDRSTSH